MILSHTLDLFPEHSSHSWDLSPQTNSFKFIDLFAGIGGFHLALSHLGGECVFASEKDAHSRVTYAANFSISLDLFNDDIRKISPIDIPDHDILCAGFPCQPFSQACHKKGFSDGENSERGNLFYCILDILEAKRPKAFILENVRHLIAHDNGETFATILKHLDEANYEVSFKVIKASDFNVPQHRARVFIVGFDRTQVKTDATFHFPIPLPLRKTMSDIFNAPCEKKIGFTLRVGGKGSQIDDRRNWEFYRVNNEVRRIGLSEATEMMTFPKDFQFPVSKTQAMKQLGNSVCVDVVKAVGQSVVQHLKKHSITGTQEMQNKGEISETYALLKIIHQKIIQYGDAQGTPTDDTVRILKIHNAHQTISINDISVDVVSTDNSTKNIPIAQFITQAELDEMVLFIRKSSSTFNNEKIDAAADMLGLNKRKGTSSEKFDILVDFQDDLLNVNQGISIKSFLGSSPTLLNASSATNFVFEVTGLDAKLLDAINQIDSRAKIKDRISKIVEHGGHFVFHHCENKTYESNLRKTDSLMPELLAAALLSFFKKETSNALNSFPDVANFKKLTADEIHCRLRDFIKYTVFGIFPNQLWDGNLSANGALMVLQDGDVLFYHTNHEKTLKEFFYQNCFFDTPSSKRHRFGSLYKENNKLFFKLNLQLRLSK